MIAKARTISHGNAYTNYSTMKHDSVFVGSRNLDSVMLLDPNDSMDFVWDEFRDEKLKYKGHGKEVTHTLIAIEASPSPEESRGWNLSDWYDYGVDLLRHIDGIEFKDRDGKVSAPKTDLLHSKSLMMLHRDSKSGILHLHIMASRFTADGRINNGNLIGIKAVTAANQINKERGWKQPEELSREHKAEIKDACYNALRDMRSWSMKDYLDRLNKAGYKTEIRTDNNNNVANYWIFWGNTRYRASDIGANLTAKKLQREWQKLHKNKQIGSSKTPSVASAFSQKTSDHPYSYSLQPEKKFKDLHVCWHDIKSDIQKELSMKVPSGVYDIFSSAAHDNHFFDGIAQEMAIDAEKIVNTAAMLYLGFIDDATTYTESFGGGGASSGECSKEKDDDDEKWARRCTLEAIRMSKQKPVVKRRR